jgi:S1-C subfamily serine protease
LFGFKRYLYVPIVLALISAGCERIPEIERKTSLGKNSENSRHLVELKKWLFTCRGTGTTPGFQKIHKDLGDKIEEFVDYFHSKGLSTVTSEEPATLVGTAVLWKPSGYLLAGALNFSDVKEIECTNGIIPWTKAKIRGVDRSLDLVVLRLDPSAVPSIKSYLLWGARTDTIAVDEMLSVLSAGYPGQVDRYSVQLQPFPSSMRTGIDENLLLFLPPLPEVSVGGLLVDSSVRVVGYVLPHQSSLWGAAISFRRADFAVASIMEKGSVPQAFTGLKARYHDGFFSVQQIEVGSPAYRSGLRLDDIILKWNRHALAQLTDWQEVSSADIGKSIPITYQRGDKIIEGEIRPASID